MQKKGLVIVCFLLLLAPCCPAPDTDGDGVGDSCDACPIDPLKVEPGICGCGVEDRDGDDDGVADCADNCPDRVNPDQSDGDGDGIGDACEAWQPPFFRDISEASGIQEENFDPDPESPIPSNDHSRLGWVDINGDGFDDAVMHNLFPNPRDAGIPFEHLVFLNNGDQTFTNFSDASGLRDIQAGFFAFGDVDDDGDPDCFAGFDYPDPAHRHTLLLNDGAGHFTVKEDSGLEGTSGNAVAGNAVFADFDADGNLDLFLGNGHTSYSAPDQLFFGRGDGTFVEKSENLQGNRANPSNGSVACDYDNDGDLDIFVSVYGVSIDNGHNVLWENDGTGVFTDVAEERGFAYQVTGNYYLESTGYGTAEEPRPYLHGTPIGSNGFGLDCRDIDNDGDLDIFATAISHPVSTQYRRKWSDPSVLLINEGPEKGYHFRNEFLTRKLPFNEGDIDGGIADFDNDGRPDLSISREIKYESAYPEEAIDQRAWFGLMRQRPDGTFRSVGFVSGINDENDTEYLKMKAAQNHAWSDIDHDGDLDLLVGGRKSGTPGVGRPNFLFENITGSRNGWIALRLVGDGVRVNRDAIGARVTVTLGEKRFIQEVKSSRGTYNSIDTRLLHFGLGSAQGSPSLSVRWPDGTAYSLGPVPRDTFLTITYPAEVR
ncbi:MAG: hypothetical protein D6812_04745 [Deltaproteobacteria bacterium]|nr:MAG: hypothetical protein D6812_04745 [Deltaproteobacteria bacterium]